MLRELAHAVSLWTIVVVGEVPEEWDKASITPNVGQGEKESLGSYSLPSHPSVPGELREQILLEATSRSHGPLARGLWGLHAQGS